MTVMPDPYEPTAAWRMSTNGWPDPLIATTLGMTKGQVLKAITEDNTRLEQIDPELWADPIIDPKKLKP